LGHPTIDVKLCTRDVAGLIGSELFAREDPNVVLYWISVWHTLHFNVKIDLEDELMQADQRSSRVQGMPAELNRRAMQISASLRNQAQPNPSVETKRHS